MSDLLARSLVRLFNESFGRPAAVSQFNDKVALINLFVSQFTAAKAEINMLFAGLGSVCIVKNCDLGHSFSLF